MIHQRHGQVFIGGPFIDRICKVLESLQGIDVQITAFVGGALYHHQAACGIRLKGRRLVADLDRQAIAHGGQLDVLHRSIRQRAGQGPAVGIEDDGLGNGQIHILCICQQDHGVAVLGGGNGTG